MRYSHFSILLPGRRWIVYLIISCFSSIVVYSQPTEESLLKTLEITPKADHDSIYYELFKVVMIEDYNKAKEYALKSNAFSKTYNHPMRFAKACRALTFVYDKSNNWDSSQLYYREGIKKSIQHNYNLLLMYLYNDYGIYFESLDVYDSALCYYNYSLRVAKEIGSKIDESTSLNNIGLVFYYLNNYKEAAENIERAIEIKRQFDIENGISLNLMNLALIYNDQGNYDGAIGLLNEVINRCLVDCDDHILASLNFDLGYVYYSRKEYLKAYDFLSKGYDLAKKFDNNKIIAYSLYYFALYKIESKDYLGAVVDLSESEKFANRINLKRLNRDIYEVYAEIYNRLGDFEKVVLYQTKYSQLKDSIFNSTIAFNLSAMQMEYQKKQSDLILQQKEAALSRSQLIIVFVLIVAVLLAIISLLLYNRYRFNKRMKQILEKQVQLRTSDLIQNNHELKQLNLEFEALINQTSKYVRGPLATLIGLISLVEREQADPERTREYIAKIKKVAGAMGLSMDQLKEVGRMGEDGIAKRKPEDQATRLEYLLKEEMD